MTIGGVSVDTLYGKYVPEARVVYSAVLGGKSQVFNFNGIIGITNKITDGLHNEKNPSIKKILGDSVITWGLDSDAAVPGGKFYLNDAGVIHPLI
ncbi:hypothetical protein [Sodalis sp. C49]|uniref:hypothetical protein n=1 Tax=Sodalis sp. C49 TaxID=3228929 RepID=UPI00396596D3